MLGGEKNLAWLHLCHVSSHIVFLLSIAFTSLPWTFALQLLPTDTFCFLSTPAIPNNISSHPTHYNTSCITFSHKKQYEYLFFSFIDTTFTITAATKNAEDIVDADFVIVVYYSCLLSLLLVVPLPPPRYQKEPCCHPTSSPLLPLPFVAILELVIIILKHHKHPVIVTHFCHRCSFVFVYRQPRALSSTCNFSSSSFMFSSSFLTLHFTPTHP